MLQDTSSKTVAGPGVWLLKIYSFSSHGGCFPRSARKILRHGSSTSASPTFKRITGPPLSQTCFGSGHCRCIIVLESLFCTPVNTKRSRSRRIMAATKFFCESSCIASKKVRVKHNTANPKCQRWKGRSGALDDPSWGEGCRFHRNVDYRTTILQDFAGRRFRFNLG